MASERRDTCRVRVMDWGLRRLPDADLAPPWGRWETVLQGRWGQPGGGACAMKGERKGRAGTEPWETLAFQGVGGLE